MPNMAIIGERLGQHALRRHITAYPFGIIHHYTNLHYPTFTSGSGCNAWKHVASIQWNDARGRNVDSNVMFSFCTSKKCHVEQRAYRYCMFSVISSQQDVAKGIVELQYKNRRPLSSFQPPQAEMTLKLLPSPEAECQRHQMTSEDQTDQSCRYMSSYVAFGSASDSCRWLWISPVLPPPSAWRKQNRTK